MGDAGDHAYSHALAVLGDPARASEVASAAVRRGGRSTTLTLAHAHRDAVATAQAQPPPPADLDAPAPGELGALAQALASTRPPDERAVIDLDGRHDLDRVRLARILSCAPDLAGDRVSGVAATWQRVLDPALLARLGPGSCGELAELLARRGLWTLPPSPRDAAVLAEDDAAEATEVEGGPVAGVRLGELIASAEPVGAHTAVCETCRDRLRAIVSVRDLVAGAPLEPVPEAVRAAARSIRFRPTAGFPAADGAHTTRLRARATVAAAILIGLLLAGGLTVVATRSDDDSATRIADLARVPATGGDLLVRPTVLRANPLPPVVLRNEGSSDVRWRIETGVPWLTAAPAEGALAAGKGVSVNLAIGGDAPEGEVRMAVNVVGDDGSTASVRIETSVERPPDLDASASGCAVTAAVEDESDIASVALYVRRPGRPELEQRQLFQLDRGWTGSLPATTETLTWWVTAIDARGNATKGAESVLPAGCTSPTTGSS